MGFAQGGGITIRAKLGCLWLSKFDMESGRSRSQAKAPLECRWCGGVIQGSSKQAVRSENGAVHVILF
jgi:hypothetical protein